MGRPPWPSSPAWAQPLKPRSPWRRGRRSASAWPWATWGSPPTVTPRGGRPPRPPSWPAGPTPARSWSRPRYPSCSGPRRRDGSGRWAASGHRRRSRPSPCGSSPPRRWSARSAPPSPCRPCSIPTRRCRSWPGPSRTPASRTPGPPPPDGRRRAVFVSGEAGAGKSRLVAEFARTVHDRGGLVLAGSCSPGLDVPYQPFVEAIGDLLEPLPVAERRELVGAGAGDLARLLPRLALTDAVPAPPTVEEPGARRYWLFEAVVELLTRLGCRAPVLVVLEDLHWAGSSTALLVDHLLGDQRLARVCLVATLRSSRQDLSDATAGVLVDLPRRPGVDRVVLEGLGTRPGQRARGPHRGPSPRRAAGPARPPPLRGHGGEPVPDRRAVAPAGRAGAGPAGRTTLAGGGSPGRGRRPGVGAGPHRPHGGRHGRPTLGASSRSPRWPA